MSYKAIILILGMALVTYIPRALPGIFIDHLKFSKKMEKFLKLIPYTAMASLIFPGVVFVDETRPEIGILGAITAGVLAFKKVPVIFCVIAAIAVDIGIYIWF